MTVVGCSVGNSHALATLQRVVSLEEADLRVLPSPLQQRHVRSLDGCAALVFDLAPWDHSAVELMFWLRRERPMLPILLYTPQILGVTELVLECGSLHGVSALSQFRTPTAASLLRREMGKLLDCPGEPMFVALVRRVTSGAPREVIDFTRLAVRTLQTERNVASLNVEYLAKKLGLSTRTLHRSWVRTPLPHPRGMLDWLMLLFVNYKAHREQLPFSRIADAIGLDRQRAYRIRKRLLSENVRTRTSNEDHAFELVLLFFLERCGVPEADAVEIKQRIWGDLWSSVP